MKPFGTAESTAGILCPQRVCALRLHRLGAALALALLTHGVSSLASVDQPHIPQPLVVQNCDDSGPDSLRDIVQNQAQSGDLVDLRQLTSYCATDSVITLTSGEISVPQDTLILRGPTEGSVTISGNHASRIFHHTGNGTLTLESLKITDGKQHSSGDASGGCIFSYAGGINLDHTIVSGCKLASDTGYAFGGAISAPGTVTLTRSTVSNSEASSATMSAMGGGIFTIGTVSATYSSVQGNTESDGPGSMGFGGGIAALSGAVLTGSTVAGNSGFYGGALFSGFGAIIGNSTISGNTSRGGDVVRIIGNTQSVVANSTIAKNHVDSTLHAGAIYFDSASPLIVKSSILGTNTAGAGNVPADLYTTSATLDATGHDNLIVASNVMAAPPGVITVTADPELGPLQQNGGPTPTHELMTDSPARHVGNNDVGTYLEQRGEGYPRASGPNASVDMGAVQFDTIFVDAFGS